MRTQLHKTYVIDDFIQEVTNLTVLYGWKVGNEQDLARSDLVGLRKDTLSFLGEVPARSSEEARKILDETKCEG